MKQPTAFIALLRGINVSGRNKIPMAELRSLCGELGCSDARTYIQSGNLIFTSPAAPADVEADLEKAIEQTFQLRIPVIIRPVTAWPVYMAANPFPAEAKREPALVMMALSKLAPTLDAASALRNRATSGERIEQAGDAIWIHFAGGVARSKLTPTLLDRLAGSPVTMRNWRTVCAIGELAHREVKGRKC